jgi:FtsZ-binding cell division protein ZapB
MAYRCDTVEIAPDRVTEDGISGYTTICRDGILTYFTADGQRIKELRPRSANSSRKFLDSLVSLPITTEHPPRLLNDGNRGDYQVGQLGQHPEYRDREGLVGNQYFIKDSRAIEFYRNGEKTQGSLGYLCDVVKVDGGIWRDPIDGTVYKGDFHQVQTNIRPNHFAQTAKARGGDRIRFDSALVDEYTDVGQMVEYEPYSYAEKEKTTSRADSRTKQGDRRGRMSTVTLRLDNLDFNDVDPGLANAINSRMDSMRKLEAEVGELREDNERLALNVATLQKKLDDANRLGEHLKGKADAYEVEIHNLVSGERLDMKDHDEMMDEDDVDSGEEDYNESRKTKKSKNHKQLSGDEAKELEKKLDAVVEARVQAHRDAEALLDIYGVDPDEVKLDSSMTPTEIQAAVYEAIRPGVDLEGMTGGYIADRFDSLVDRTIDEYGDDDDEEEERNDSASSRLKNNIRVARSSNNVRRDDSEQVEEKQSRFDAAWKRPLAISK